MGAGDDVHANATCLFCFFCCFLCVSHFAAVFTVVLPNLDFLHMPAWTCICLSALCGGGGGGWGDGGVMTSMIAAGCSVKPLLPLLVAHF